MSAGESAPLDGKVALVTGASRGIGRAIAVKLASLGARVFVNYARNVAEAEATIQEIRSVGKGSAESSEAIQFDVSSAEDVLRGIEDILKRAGSLDILINNAGIALDSLLVRQKLEDWQRTLDVNLSGAFYCARAVAKPMMKSRWGRIVNISSVIGEMGNAGQTAYSASKAGMIGLTKSLAKELASRNVTVNAVTPGYIATDMTSTMTDDRREEMLKHIPLGRLGEATDVAELTAFLCLPGSSYITGQAIGVNGGMYI